MTYPAGDDFYQARIQVMLETVGGWIRQHPHDRTIERTPVLWTARFIEKRRVRASHRLFWTDPLPIKGFANLETGMRWGITVWDNLPALVVYRTDDLTDHAGRKITRFGGRYISKRWQVRFVDTLDDIEMRFIDRWLSTLAIELFVSSASSPAS